MEVDDVAAGDAPTIEVKAEQPTSIVQEPAQQETSAAQIID